MAALTVVVIVGVSFRTRADEALYFEDDTAQAGLGVASPSPGSDLEALATRAAGGVAVSDVDQDGDLDAFVARPGQDSLLFLNDGTGFFSLSEESGLARQGEAVSGPLFFDYDGDGRLDLFVGSTEVDAPTLFRNRGAGKFEDVTRDVGLDTVGPTLSATAGDYDRDGDLDLFLSHWSYSSTLCHLWRNESGRRFYCADRETAVDSLAIDGTDKTFTGNFVDLDRDGWPELLVSSDFGTSCVLHNRGDGTFERGSDPAISDENGMGSAIGDYDGDGREDWFVTSIFDPDGVAEGDWGVTGNRLYRSLGDGTFADQTESAGVRKGAWGWAACFADFDLDGWLDLMHVNGWPQGSADFRGTRAPLFMRRPDARFIDVGAELGLLEQGGGRGLSCLDVDQDGDLDVLVGRHDGSLHLWRNMLEARSVHYLKVALVGQSPNPTAVGSVVEVSSAGRVLVRSVRAGSNYASQDPLVVHFGLGNQTQVDTVRVHWPDGAQSQLSPVDVDQEITLEQQGPPLRAAGCGVGW